MHLISVLADVLAQFSTSNLYRETFNDDFYTLALHKTFIYATIYLHLYFLRANILVLHFITLTFFFRMNEQNIQYILRLAFSNIF